MASADPAPPLDVPSKTLTMLTSPPYSRFTRPLVYLVHKFLTEENYHETARWLEQESGFFFNVGRLESLLMAGEWDAAERYLSGFTGIGDNQLSTEIFFEIRKQKYYEALDRGDKAAALTILNELQAFDLHCGDEYKQLAVLLALDNFRDNKKHSRYGDTETMRKELVAEVDKKVRANPALQDKIVFPKIDDCRLRHHVACSYLCHLNHCKIPRPPQEFESMLFGHSCSTTDSARVTSSAPRLENFLDRVGLHGGESSSTTPMQSATHDPKDSPECLPKRAAAPGAAEAYSVRPPARNRDKLPEWLVQRMAKLRTSSPEGAVVTRPNSEGVARRAHSAPPAEHTTWLSSTVLQKTTDGAQMGKLPQKPCFAVSKTQSVPSDPAPVLHPTPRVAPMTTSPSPTHNHTVSKFPVNTPPKEVVLQKTTHEAQMAKPSQAPSFIVSKTQNMPSHPAPMPHPAPRVAPMIASPSPKPNDTISNSSFAAPSKEVLQQTTHGAQMAKPSQEPYFAVSKTKIVPSHPAPVPHPTPKVAPMIASPSPNPSHIISEFSVVAPSKEAFFKRPRTLPTNNTSACRLADEDKVPKRPRHGETSNESFSSSNDFPKQVAKTLNQGSYVQSMDFHPSQPALLLVGTNVGDVAVWEITLGERLVLDKFEVWNLPACSVSCKESLLTDSSVAVNRVAWNPNGSQFAIACSRYLVHLYTYNGHYNVTRKLEIEAHVGEVNDLTFLPANDKLCLVTCGNDKTVKFWDAITGEIQYTWDGHEAPVLSISSHITKFFQLIHALSSDGKLRAMVYNVKQSFLFHVSHFGYTSMLLCDDGNRWLICQINEAGEAHIRDSTRKGWIIKEKFNGVSSLGYKYVVHFDASSRFLAAGDLFKVKLWDIDPPNNLLMISDVEGALPASPYIRFNKDGSILAVSTIDNCIKLLANADGLQLLRSRSASQDLISKPNGTVCGLVSTDVAIADRGVPGIAMAGMHRDSQTLKQPKFSVICSFGNSGNWEFGVISEPNQCRSLKLPDNSLAVQVCKLLYMNSGVAILVLPCNGLHKLWKWQSTDKNECMKATTCVAPQQWQSPSNERMTNVQSDATVKEPIHCFALSKNDSFLVSTSGGPISLYAMKTFKQLATFSPSHSVATCLAFYPRDNNIIAIGMEDSSICIYNIQLNEVRSILRGHQKRITGLAFSDALEILVSLGADNKLCIWDTNEWKMQGSEFMQTTFEGVSSPLLQTQLQFHMDQIHFLVVQEMFLAIYEATKQGCLKEFAMDELIIHAAYSCDGKSVYAISVHRTVFIFDATTKILRHRCWILPTAYLPPQLSSRVGPLLIVAHPSDSNQFALGLSDGGVKILEPLESDGKWITQPLE